MNQNARLVHHCQVQRTPVLKEGHIKELIIYREVVVLRVVVRCGRCGSLRLSAYPRLVLGFVGDAIEVVGAWRGVGEGREVQPE